MTAAAVAPPAAPTRSMSRRADAYDVVRAVAAISVVYGHAGQLVPNSNHSALGEFLTHHANAGVFLFFSLSGYLICRPYVRALVSGAPLPDARTYAVRRAARILPAYWIALLAMVAVVRPLGTTPAGVVGHLLLIHDWIPGQSGTILIVAWTLGIEAAFYLLVPLTAAALRARAPRTTAATLLRVVLLASLSSLLTLLLPTPLHGDAIKLVTENIPGTLFYFAPGIVIAILETEREGARRLEVVGRHRFALCGLAVGLWFATSGLGGLPTALGTALFAIGICVACGAVMLAARATAEIRSVHGRALRRIGTWSYGVYLWHWPVIGVLSVAGVHLFTGPADLEQTALWVAVMLVVLPLGAASWRYVERPCLDAVAGWRFRPQHAASAPAVQPQPQPAAAAGIAPR